VIVCKECGKNFDTSKGLHGHLRAHKKSVKEYYEFHYPRCCLQTGHKVVWKDGDAFEEYMQRDFVDQKALEAYFSVEDEGRQKLLKDYLESDCKRHQVGMCAAEYSSLSLSPTLRIYLDRLDYVAECGKIGVSTRFDYSRSYDGALPIAKVDSRDFCILIDSREQNPYEFFSQIRGKIGTGDYTLGGQLFNGIVIERKSLQDFGGTLGSGLDRFKRELARVREEKRYLVVLVEYPIKEIFNYRFYGRCQAPYFFHRMRELIREFSDVSQWVFGGYRWNCVKLVPMFLLCGQECRKIDLQLWCDLNNSIPRAGPFTQQDLENLYAYP
jgi:hypothetical protein